jgi:putative transposase
MRGTRHSEEQIIAILKQAENGVKTAEVCRQHGITEATLYRWKAKFGGMEVSDAKKLKALEDENRRLKQMVADQALDIQALKAVVAKKW